MAACVSVRVLQPWLAGCWGGGGGGVWGGGRWCDSCTLEGWKAAWGSVAAALAVCSWVGSLQAEQQQQAEQGKSWIEDAG